MSGHSHWSSIKHKKGTEDEKRGKVFSKMSRLIALAAKEKGGDPETNAFLRVAIDKAKSFNMPQSKIENAIKKGTGEIKGGEIENLLLEGFGPGGIAVLIEAVTDNKNRTLSEVRHTFEKFGGKSANGGVLWMFEKKGIITLNSSSIQDRENLELVAIDAGAQDIKEGGEIIEIYAKQEDVELVKKALEGNNINIENYCISWVPKEEISILDEKLKKKIENLFETLDESDDVQGIYSNLKN